MLDDFHAWLCRRGRERSADQYVRVVRRYLSDPRMETAITARKYSPNYRRHLTACLRAWAKFSGDRALEERLEDVKLPAPVPADVREPLDTATWARVREAIASAPYLKEPTRHVCGLIAARGIRCGDVLRLSKKSIAQAVSTGTLSYEGKGERWMTFSARLLLPHLEGLLACRWTGGRVRNLVCPGSAEDKCQETAGREIRRAFDRVAEDLGVPREDLFAHRFRHTYATHFLQKMQGDPEAVFKLQTQMGWARLDTAANYLRRSRREELDAVEAQLFEESES